MEEALLSRPQRSTDLEDACFSTQKKVPGIYYIPSNESVVVVRRYNPNCRAPLRIWTGIIGQEGLWKQQ